MKLTIHRGSHEIGGNCVEIATDSTRIILDVGMPLFDADRQPFDGSVVRGKTVDELLGAGILPNVSGLFTAGPPPDAILLSHAHMDHTGFLPFTREEIPVYATTGTSKMMSAGAIFARQVEIPRQRYRRLVPEKVTRLGDLRVTAFSVDHSVYGSVAFLIEGQGKTILYSGDLRLHGRKTGMAKTLLAALKNKTVDLLFLEGTLLGGERSGGVTEYELEEEITKRIASNKSLVLASFSPQHVDRLVCFIRAAQRTRRTFVIDVYTAYVMHLIRSEVKIPAPKQEEGIRVFYPAHFLVNRDRHRKIHDLFLAEQVTLEEVLTSPTSHVMLFRPSMLQSDFSDQLPPGTLCLFSRWEGYLEQAEWQHAEKALQACSGELVTMHTSGHAFAEDLQRLAAEIDPRLVIPMHTFEPHTFELHFSNVRVLQDGEPYDLG